MLLILTNEMFSLELIAIFTVSWFRRPFLNISHVKIHIILNFFS